MEKKFDSIEYVKQLSEELIYHFSRASIATTPGLVGTARENVVREKLKALFPNYISIGTGCVIDTYKNTSKQTDIILYGCTTNFRFCEKVLSLAKN